MPTYSPSPGPVGPPAAADPEDTRFPACANGVPVGAAVFATDHKE